MPDDASALAGWLPQEKGSELTHLWFGSRAAARPDTVALVGLGERVTYGTLEARANRLARLLRKLGVQDGQRVGLLLPRSADAVVTMLAILKAGAAFVPLDLGYPRDMLRLIVEDCAPSVIVYSSRALAALGADVPWHAPTLDLATLTGDLAKLSPLPLPSTTAPSDAAYVMYTSGSTGRPKGVVVPHRAIVRLVDQPNYVELGPDETILHMAPLAFDASTFEIWGALLNGGRVAILSTPQPSLDDIANAITRHGVTTMFITAALFNLMIDHRPEAFGPLRQLLAGGEVLSPQHVARALRALPACRLTNAYGPTENTTFSCFHPIRADTYDGGPVPIGTAIGRTTCYVLDEQLRPVADGESGQLCLGGDGLALGYLGLPEQTAAAFVPNPFDPVPDARLYLTGDRVRRRSDGVFELLGRDDRQIKLSGKRIELDEIEIVLRDGPAVRDAAVTVHGEGARRRIAGYVTGPANGASAQAALRTFLRHRLPPHMIPADLTILDAMPMTPTGKIDRKQLPAPVAPAAADAPDRGDIERTLTEIWRHVLGTDAVTTDANFFDLGGTSLMLTEAHALIQAQIRPDVSLVELFRLSTIRDLAGRLAAQPEAATHAPAAPHRRDNRVAIVGMAGRFPGAPDVATFWENLVAGRETITRLDPAEIEDAHPPATRATAAYVAARPLLDDVDQFDPGFFGMQQREAELTDPQHRVFLECAWEAFEDAGYDPARVAGAIGVFAGSSINTYFLHHVCRDRATIETFTTDYQIGSYPMLLGAGADFLATRVAYKLGLRGPAIVVQSACSTSLLAVAQACQSLLAGESDMALAGGVSISFPQQRGYLHQEGGMGSPDGHCRAFDSQAAGTVFGAGAGVVLLKRLADAMADGDRIVAVVDGSAVNNDGAAKVGFTAPGVDGQAAVIAAAHRAAGVSARDISYVECHGTATPIGDPIEIAGLTKAFRETTGETGFCAIGSVKTNVGHLDVAAGITGLIKTALALQHATLPATLHFNAPNPRIDFASSPFVVNRATRPWEADGPRIAGVSAFGVGGTNVHVVLREPPAVPAPAASGDPELIVLSARSPAALAQARARLARQLREQPGTALADAAGTLQLGRRAFVHRCAVVAATASEAASLLDAADANAAGTPVVAFMFPGQGAQYAGMGRALHASEPAFRRPFDECAEIVRGLTGTDFRALMHSDAGVPLVDTGVAQPALFAVEYALAQMWMGWGVRPAALIGHSVGELVAACLAGVMSLPEALGLVAARGRLMRSVPAGAMLAVRLPEAELTALLPQGLSIAAVNAPSLCVAAGPEAAIAAFECTLTDSGAQSRRLHTSHAFHSEMMDPVVEPLAAHVDRIVLSAPRLPILSCVTGDWLSDAEATSADYWARHCRAPVRFADGLARLVADHAPVLLELGPGRTLATLARQGAGRASVIATSLPDATEAGQDRASVLAALGRIWSAGVAVDWSSVREASPWRRVPLPTVPFERVRCWIDAPPQGVVQVPPTPSLTPETEPPMTEALIATAPGETLHRQLVEMLQELSGEDLAAARPTDSFVALGFDSLFLGQFAQRIGARFGVTIAFRDLLGRLDTLAALAAHLAPHRPAEPVQPAPTPAPTPVRQSAPTSVVERVVQEQLRAMQELMARQLQALGAAQAAEVPAPVVAPEPAPVQTPSLPSRFDSFRPGACPISTGALTERQRRHIAALVAETVARTPGSKQHTQAHRRVLADPRVAAGFRAEWKEMVYPIVVARSAGANLWDIDGNQYVDLVNGFGQTAFGHAPDFVTEAVAAQMATDMAIGPQTPLAGEVAELFAELTGHERVTFCCTGSEAVMAAMRIARAVTGRDRIATFAGDYHGQFDEVLVKGAANGPPRALPVASGIPAASVGNMVVLPYGTAESLAWLRANMAEIAAVVVEPVQSRNPALQPREFLHELRALTAQAGTALVFDEVVTGFRMHPGGIQALFGIRADMATYGKVVGGGLPVGILAGAARFMDALDGGAWDYGDESYPQTAPTFFAGTFVRHPLVLAAVRAVLLHMKSQGPALIDVLTQRTAALVARLNADLARRGLRTRFETCGSLFYTSFAAEERLSALLYVHLRNRGVHIQEGFPCFLTTAHSDADIDRIASAFAASLDALQADGIFGEAAEPARELSLEVVPTEPQMEIWLAAQLGDAASCAFNESVCLTLDGPLDHVALHAALNGVVARHDALRSHFSATGERLHVVPSLSLDLPVTADASEATLAELVQEDAALPFDLVGGPLLRAHLVRLESGTNVLILTAHHIVCDGWSVNVIAAELAALYAANRAGAPAALPAPLPFSAYASQPRRDAAATDAFWRDHFADPVTALNLPTDRPRPPRKSFRGATHHAAIDAALLRAIKRAGSAEGCTLFATLLATFQALMGRLAGQDDVVVGVPFAGQTEIEGRVLVGHCVQFLPLRARWTAETTVADHLRAVRQTVLDAAAHADTTLGTIVRQLDRPREAGRMPLAEVQFNLERLPDDLAMDGAVARLAANPKRFVNFDLFLNVVESADGLRLDCDYNTDLFDADTVVRWLRHYRTTLAALAEGGTLLPHLPLAHLPLLDSVDLDRMRQRNDMAAPFDAAAGIHTLVARSAAAHTAATAVVCGDQRLSYGEMERRANRLARHLRATVAGPDARIGILMRRSVDLPVALLATLKAGFAYVPLDPAHPPARLRDILTNAAVSAVLVDDAGSADAAPDGIACIRLDTEAAAIERQAETPLNTPAPASRAAYVIFTSGSTGAPKGVEIGHSAVVNLLTSMARTPGFRRGQTLLSVTTVAFDIAALELFLPLVVGGTVVMADTAEAADGFALWARMRDLRPDMVQATPSLWRILLEAGFRSWPGLSMLCGGETLPRDLADRLLEGGGALWNMYGPTETTIWSACGRVARDDDTVTAGGPIANTTLHVLDGANQIAPPGVVGELFIGGAGLAGGYFRRPDLTEAAFPTLSLGGGEPIRLYRTGDRARLLPDGRVQLLGRADGQVKLRGVRMELGEIEAALADAGAPGSAVLLRDAGTETARLVAYVVAPPDGPDPTAELTAALAARLPDHMVPRAWVRLAAMPLTPNGKLDRRALPPPAAATLAARPRADAPETPLERQLAAIWEEVLRCGAVGRSVSLFALGADSIQIFQIAARMDRAGLALGARDLMAHPTIADLATAAGARRITSNLPSLRDYHRTRRQRPAPRLADGDREKEPS